MISLWGVSLAAMGSPPEDAGTGPSGIDVTPPQVVAVAVVTPSETADLEDCRTTALGVTGLRVSFDEPVQNPAGNDGVDDVTNPANYRVIGAGADQDIDTVSCGAVQGDDLAVTIDAVTYTPGSFTAELALNGGQALADSAYRLLVCGSTTIRDLDGNPLDGDGNGTGGDDFSRHFRIDSGNHLDDGRFDCSLDAWLAASTDPGEIQHSADDIDGAGISGSAAITNLTASTNFSIGQCLPLDGPLSFSFDGRIRLDVGAGVVVDVTRYCEYFTSPDCSGDSVAILDEADTLGGTAGGWQMVQSAAAVAQDSGSLLCSLELHNAAGVALDARFDEVRLTGDVAPAERLLQDGFETALLPMPGGDGGGGGGGDPFEPDPTLMCDTLRPPPVGTEREEPFEFIVVGGTSFQNAETFEDVWGPWPGTSNSRFLRIPAGKYVALPFITNASGSMRMDWFGVPGVNAASTLVSLSRCPGDLDAFTLDRPCWQASGTEGASVRGAVGGATNTCTLEPNTLYFVNVIHSTALTPEVTACPVETCLWLASP